MDVVDCDGGKVIEVKKYLTFNVYDQYIQSIY